MSGDGARRTFRALTSGPNWQGAHRDRADLPRFTGRPSEAPAFDGHPSGVPDAGLPEPLPDLVDVEQAPPSPAEIMADHGARLERVEGMAHTHEVPEPNPAQHFTHPDNPADAESGPWND
jgi:hypothetical protein